MKLTEKFKEILDSSLGKDSYLIDDLIQAVKERDEIVGFFDEYQELEYDGWIEEKGHYFFETKIIDINDKRYKKMEESL